MLNILSEEAETNFASLTPGLAANAARIAEANTLVVGNLYKSGGQIRITSNIMDPESEMITKSFELQGATEDDFFILADSLSRLIRDYLEIKSLQQEVFYEMKSVYTHSSEAYKHYLMGQNYFTILDYPNAIENFSKAIELDSSFISAMLRLAYCYGDIQQAQLSRKWAYKAFEQMDRLPTDMQLLVQILIASVEKRPLDQVQYLNLYLSLHPQAMLRHYQLGWVRFNLEEWDKAIESFERSLELGNKQGTGAWVWAYSMLGNAYHNAGLHKKEQDIFEKGRERWPEQKSRFDYWQAVCAISQGDSTKAEIYLEEIRKMTEQAGWPEANIMLWYAGAYNWGEDYENADYYYRKSYSIRPENPQLIWEFAQFLISRDISPEEGLELIIPLVEEYPNNASYLYTYGLGLYKQGNYQEAMEAVQKSWNLRAYYDHKNYTLFRELEDILARAES
jgi:tetratricopeptide (TPR) repeat protein